jgi:hypothetical protein
MRAVMPWEFTTESGKSAIPCARMHAVNFSISGMIFCCSAVVSWPPWGSKCRQVR